MANLVSIKEFEEHAYKILPKNSLDYYRSGAGQQLTLKQNREAFSRYRIRPRCLRNVEHRDLSTTILGEKISMPIGISPTAMQRMAHPEGECANVQAAQALGTIFTLSTLATSSIEEVAQAAPHALKWYQLYIYKDREVTRQLVQRAERAGFKALVLTVDAPLFGLRLADMKNKFSLPSHLSSGRWQIKLASGDSLHYHCARTAWNYHQYQSDVGWGNKGISPEEVAYLRANKTGFETLANFKGRKSTDISKGSDDGSGLNSYSMSLFDPTLNWRDIQWLKTITRLPIVLKGILTAEDALLGAEAGAAAILVSNHGARQVDGTPASVEALPEIVKAVGNRVEVYMDGGVTDGTDVFKALGLGAKMVFIGRPAIWGLAHSGQEGVKKVLNILRNEFDTALGISELRKPKIHMDILGLSFLMHYHTAIKKGYDLLKKKIQYAETLCTFRRSQRLRLLSCTKISDIKPNMVVHESFYSKI